MEKSKKVYICDGCGWKGTKEKLFHRDDSGEDWWCDQHECPICLEVIINNLEPIEKT